MDYIYLGLFSKIFNWVVDKIFSPVFNLLARLIAEVLSWAFNEILIPIIKSILIPLLELTVDLIVDMLADFFYLILVKLLQIIDVMSNICDYMIGTQPVTYVKQVGSSYTFLKESFLEILMFETTVGKLFWYINMVGLILTMTLAVIAVARSAADIEMTTGRSVGRVMGSTLRAFLNLMTVNFVVYFLVKLSVAILQGINIAFNQVPNIEGETAGTGATLGSMIFTLCTMSAAKDSKFNLSGKAISEDAILHGSTSLPSVMDSWRSKFFLHQADYANIKIVKESFHIRKLDFITGYIVAIFLALMLAACVLVFIQRIYNLILLYVASPFFISYMPLDDGEKFAKWRELFFGTLFSGYGMLMSMKLYLIICPNIMSGSVHFSKNSLELDYLIKLVFLLGGAWAVLKSGTILTSLISQEAGKTEQQAAVAGTAAGAFVLKGTVTATAKYVGSKLTGGQKDGGGGGGGGQGENEEKKLKDTRNMSGADAFDATKYKANTNKANTNKANTNKAAQNGGKANNKSGKQTNAKGDKGKEKSFFKEHNEFKLQKSGLLFDKYKDDKGNTRTGYNFGLGKLLGVKRDNKGTSIRLAGFRLRWGADGKINKVQIPFAKWKTGNDGKLHCARWSAAGLVNVKADNADGSLHLREIAPIGLKREKGSDNEYHVTDVGAVGMHREEGSDGQFHLSDLGILGIKREEQENGEYRVTSAAGGLYQQSFAMNDDGKSLSNAGIRAFGMNWKIDHEKADHNQLANLKNQ